MNLSIAFWVVMLFILVGGVYLGYRDRYTGGYSLLVFLALVFIGLKVFPW